MKKSMHLACTIAIALAAAACSSGGGTAKAHLDGRSGSPVSGDATFTDKGGKVEVVIEASGLTPGNHGVHVHEKGDCSASDASSAGPHFAPGGGAHAGPTDAGRHGGDLGNLEAGADGKAKLTITSDKITVAAGEHSVVGRAIVIHADADDLKSQPAGNSGSRVACGVIAKE
jgi:Cu-Zn family superoxide dismutase